MPNHFHWRQIFDVVRGEVILLNQLSQLDEERNVPLRDVVTRLEENRIILGKKRHQLNLVLLQPKQRARPGDLDATVGKDRSSRIIDSIILPCRKGPDESVSATLRV